MTKKHIELLGFKAQDKVTGFKGVITCISFDLFGCIQAIVSPAAKATKIEGGVWFDVSRLKIISKNRVMEIPKYDIAYSENKNDTKEKNKIISSGNKGPELKPIK